LRLALSAGLALAAVGDAGARACNPRIRFSTPTGRFADNGDGTVTDHLTGLTWQRCPVGFTLSDGGTPGWAQDDRCVPGAGDVTFAWQAALQGTAALNQAGGAAGHTDWRLPNVKELASIVETRCVSPSINDAIFPDTPAAPFLSSSPVWGPPTFTGVRTVDFSMGYISLVGATRAGYVRLVR
jgi:hypothetical protein